MLLDIVTFVSALCLLFPFSNTIIVRSTNIWTVAHFFVFWPNYTTTMDVKLKNQHVIEVYTFVTSVLHLDVNPPYLHSGRCLLIVDSDRPTFSRVSMTR